jgi:hypothetical protein
VSENCTACDSYVKYPCTCTGDMLADCDGCKEWVRDNLIEREEC